jgi:hypothetical protein
LRAPLPEGTTASSSPVLRRSYPFATAFLGDYSGIAATADGGVVALWTDMRNSVTFGGRTGHGEDVYFSKIS